jgi:tRNA pseudouridine-54 N-methylase
MFLYGGYYIPRITCHATRRDAQVQVLLVQAHTHREKIRLQNKQIDKISAHLKSICLEITKNYLNILVLVMEIIRVREAKLRTMKSTIEKAEQYVASKLP